MKVPPSAHTINVFINEWGESFEVSKISKLLKKLISQMRVYVRGWICRYFHFFNKSITVFIDFNKMYQVDSLKYTCKRVRVSYWMVLNMQAHMEECV